MKPRITLIFTLIVILLLTGCATTSAGFQSANNVNHSKSKKLLFKDWKYKGFGQPLPDWVEGAYRDDVEYVRKVISIPEGYEVKIETARGINSDQANKSLLQKLSVRSELFELYDSSWVLLSEKEAAANNSYPYFAAAVLLIHIKE